MALATVNLPPAAVGPIPMPPFVVPLLFCIRVRRASLRSAHAWPRASDLLLRHLVHGPHDARTVHGRAPGNVAPFRQLAGGERRVRQAIVREPGGAQAASAEGDDRTGASRGFDSPAVV